MTAEQLRQGKLEQTCPDCGRWEAAGAYCTGCSRKTGPADWYLNGDERERDSRGAQRRPPNPPLGDKRGPGRPRRVLP